MLLFVLGLAPPFKSHPTNVVGPEGFERQTDLRADARTQRFPAEHSSVTTRPLFLSPTSKPIGAKQEMRHHGDAFFRLANFTMWSC